MGIVFFCQSCGARFEVDARMAGKKGRCKKCGQFMEIPLAEQIASMSAMPAMAVAAGAPAGAGASVGSWLKDASSNVGLAAVTADRIPIGLRRGAAPSPMDDADDSKPYVLAQPLGREKRRASPTGPNVLVQAWRTPLGGIQKLFRKVNETAYLISLPFLMILMLGAAVRSRNTALFAATVVVLLNVARLVTGAVSLAVVPLRDGINTRKMKKPLRRVVEPAVTIGLVVIAFTFIPWLRTGDSGQGSIADRLKAGAGDLRKEMKGEVDKAVDKANEAGLDDLATQAKAKLEEAAKGLGEAGKRDGKASASDAPQGKESDMN